LYYKNVKMIRFLRKRNKVEVKVNLTWYDLIAASTAHRSVNVEWKMFAESKFYLRSEMVWLQIYSTARNV